MIEIQAPDPEVSAARPGMRNAARQLPERGRSDRAVSLLGALVLHVGVLSAGGKTWVRAAEYGLQPGSGGMELELIAALPSAAGDEQEQPAQRAVVAASLEEDIVPSESTPVVVADVSEHPPQTLGSVSSESSSLSAVGDGSSPIPGADPSTFQSEGGGLIERQSGYLRNPTPAYPHEARRLGQEGLVVLIVRINPSGHPTSVELGQSSGFPRLDHSALRTVRRWRFRPTTIGGVAIESVVEVPIRFVLKS